MWHQLHNISILVVGVIIGVYIGIYLSKEANHDQPN